MAIPLDGNLPRHGLLHLLMESICLHTCPIHSLPGAQEGHPGMSVLWMEPCSTQTPEGRLYLEPGLLGSSCHGATRVNAKGQLFAGELSSHLNVQVLCKTQVGVLGTNPSRVVAEVAGQCLDCAMARGFLGKHYLSRNL